MIDIKAPKPELVASLARVGGIVGFVALLGIGMWGSVAVARNAPNMLSSLAAAVASLTSVFVPGGEKIVLSAPSLTVHSGEAFEISWEHVRRSGEGSYALRYDCANGVSFTSPAPSGGDAPVVCETSFAITGPDSITLTGTSDENRFADVMLHIDFVEGGGGRTVSGSTLVTIANEAVGAGPSATADAPKPSVPLAPGPSTTTTYPLTPEVPKVAPDPKGLVDLAVRVIEQGFVNKDSGLFTASSSPNRAGGTYRIAVRFVVENLGARTSPQWTFNAVLPTFPSHIYSSPSQQALSPGDRIEFTLAFDSIADQDSGTFTVNVDPTGSMNESNKDNNIVHYTVVTIQ